MHPLFNLGLTSRTGSNCPTLNSRRKALAGPAVTNPIRLNQSNPMPTLEKEASARRNLEACTSPSAGDSLCSHPPTTPPTPAPITRSHTAGCPIVSSTKSMNASTLRGRYSRPGYTA